MAKTKKTVAPKSSTKKAAASAPSTKATTQKLATLRGLLGKPVEDPAVAAVIASSGKVKVTSDHVVAKEAHFEFALSLPEGKKKKVLSRLFLGDAYPDLPKGFERTTRDELLTKLPPPKLTWTVAQGSSPVDSPDVSHDTWDVDGVEVTANYHDGKVHDISLSLSDDALGGGRLMTSPLHFATKPPDAVADAELTGIALLVAWAVDRHGLSAKHASTEAGKQFAKRAITPRRFVIDACERNLTTLDVQPKLGEFLSTYTDNTHHDDKGGRAKTDAEIKALLKLDHDDTCSYGDDYRGTFKDVLDNPFHIPDSWDAVDRIAPIIDARLADFEATRFRTSPDVTLYTAAVALRDARPVTAERATIETVTIDDALADELGTLVGKSLGDKHVKNVLQRAGLPIGKRIDEQANPALGIVYMGAKFEIDGKNTLGIDYLRFYGRKEEKYVRGIGAKVELAAYTGALPRGLRMGCDRAVVLEKLGPPAENKDDWDVWEAGGIRTACQYEADKLVHMNIAMPRRW